MGLLGEVHGTTHDVVFAGQDVFYGAFGGFSFGVQTELYTVAHRNGVGVFNALETKLSFDAAIVKIACTAFYPVPASCGSINNSLVQCKRFSGLKIG